MKAKHCLFTLALFVVGFAYYAYDRFPDNAEQPMIQLMSFFPFKIIGDVCGLASHTGVISSIQCMFDALNFYYKKRGGLSDANFVVSDVTLDGIDARLYKPRDANDDVLFPAIIFIHGGGWMLMTKETCDELARQLARDTNSVVVSLEYRKSPKYRYPAAFDDCLKATKYFMKKAKTFGVDSKRIGIAGDSAGGNLAMAVSLKLSETKHEPALRLQALIYPALQMADFNTPSFTSYEEGPYLLKKHLMVFFWLYYAFGSIDNIEAFKQNNHTTQELRAVMDRSLLPEKYRRLSVSLPEHTDKVLHDKVKSLLKDKYLVPLMCSDEDLKKLPKTYILTCEYDPLRDEGIILAERMRKLKIPVTHHDWEGMTHAFLSFAPLLDQTHVAMSHLLDFLKKELKS